MMHPRISPLFIFAGFFVLLMAYSSLYIVSQTEIALVTEFGNPKAVEMEPGLKFKLPFVQTVEYFDNRLLEYAMPDEIEINSSDEKRIKIEAFLRWRIIDPLAFNRATRTAGIGGNRISTMNGQLSNMLGSALRQVIGSAKFNDLLSPERDHIMSEIRQIISNQTSSASVGDDKEKGTGFGIEIVDVRIVKADLPAENSEAIFKRMEAERKREATTYRAEGDQDAQTIKAGAERDKTVILAEAARQAEITRGEGDAEASRIYADAFGKDPKFFEFYRSMQSYSRALNKDTTTLVLSPDSQFLKEFSKPDSH